MNKGTVKWFDVKKGFGFIEMEDGNDIFVHHSGIKSDDDFKKLKDGDKVTFDIGSNDKGDIAENVVVVKAKNKE